MQALDALIAMRREHNLTPEPDSSASRSGCTATASRWPVTPATKRPSDFHCRRPSFSMFFTGAVALDQGPLRLGRLRRGSAMAAVGRAGGPFLDVVQDDRLENRPQPSVSGARVFHHHRGRRA